jgi:hypothetical protein
MLDQYLTETRRLLQNPAAPVQLFTTADLTAFINTARGQLAEESECIKIIGTLALVDGTRSYAFSSINIGVAATTGAQRPFKVNQISVNVGTGQFWLTSRPWPWFKTYFLGQVVPDEEQPTDWAQFAQGVAGTIFFYPLPDTSYTANLDCVCDPIDLTDDNTVEAIPYPFTDAVSFLAAYYAYMSVQRQSDANTMMERYEQKRGLARRGSTPSVLPTNYPQVPDPTIINKLGLPAARNR